MNVAGGGGHVIQQQRPSTEPPGHREPVPTVRQHGDRQHIPAVPPTEPRHATRQQGYIRWVYCIGIYNVRFVRYMYEIYGRKRHVKEL